MHEPPFYEFVDALTSLVTIASSPLNFDAEPDSIESIDSSRFRFIRSGDARLYFIRNFKYFDSIDTKLQLFSRHIETKDGRNDSIEKKTFHDL